MAATSWVYSFNAPTGDLKRMDDDDEVVVQEEQKEEFPSRIRHDGDDRHPTSFCLIPHSSTLYTQNQMKAAGIF